MFLCQKNNYDHINENRRDIDFNENWQFALNNGSFTDVNLPHDWSIHLDFNHQSPAQNEAALLDGGWGVYRKIFTFDPALKGKKVLLYFEGVYMDSKVFINGHYVGAYPNGYLPFYFYIDQYLYTDRPNRIEVHVNHQQPSSRWYSGSGIYRDVKIHVLDSTHFLPHRTHISYNWEQKELVLKSELSNKITHLVTKVSYQQEELATFSENINDDQCTLHFPFTNVIPWDIENPQLYDFEIQAKLGDEVLDVLKIKTGFKMMDWDADSGFYLNGRQLLLKGVCMHHDHGALGARSYRGAIQRQLETLKKMGVNAIRTAHTPFDQKFLSICDEMGFLVIEEAFDTWYQPKKEYDYARFFEQKANTTFSSEETWAQWDLQEMVRKSFNHPSIFMWSVGNEIAESNDGSTKAVQTVRNLVRWVKEIDTSRYVTMGQDVFRWAAEGGHEKIASELDAVGLNYAEDNFDIIRKKHPNWKIYGSETSSATSSRGIFALPDSKIKHDNRRERNFQQSDYGNDCVNWGKTAFDAWAFDRDHPDYAGQFVWTGFDYLGEPTPWHNQNHTPAKSSFFGIIDTAGFPKSDYYFYQSQWSKKKMLHIIPHWTWDTNKIKNILKTKDQKIPVRVYSNCQHVELFLNGKSLGIKSYQNRKDILITQEGMPYFEWRVDYEEGLLEAYAWDKGDKKIHQAIKTAEKAQYLQVKGEKYDRLHYVEVSAFDRKGVFHPWADHLVQFDLEGDAEIIGVDNGNPSSLERYQIDAMGKWKRRLFSGKALVIIKENKNCSYFKLKAQSKNLESAFYQYGHKEKVSQLTICSQTKNVVEKQGINLKVHIDQQPIEIDKLQWLCDQNTLAMQNGKLFFTTPGNFVIQAKYQDTLSNKLYFHVKKDQQKTKTENLILHLLNNVPINPSEEIFFKNEKGLIDKRKASVSSDFTVDRRTLESFESIKVKVNPFQTPLLPHHVELSLDDGQRLYAEVQWPEVNGKQLSEAGEHTIDGKLLRFQHPIQAKISVSNNYLLGSNFVQTWTGSDLPMIFADKTLKGNTKVLNDVSKTKYWYGKDGFVGVLFGEKGDLSKKYINNLRIYGKMSKNPIELFYYIGEKPPLIMNPNNLQKEPHPFNNENNWRRFENVEQKLRDNHLEFTMEGRESYAILIQFTGPVKWSEIEIYEAIPQ